MPNAGTPGTPGNPGTHGTPGTHGATRVPVDFYFDFACPWTWVSSRWLLEAAAQRPVDVRWRPFSLLLKNGDDTPDDKREQLEVGLQAARVAVALDRVSGNDAVASFYTTFGRVHFDDDGGGTSDITVALDALGLDPRFASAASDESLDAILESHAVDAEKMAGPDAGSPVLAIEDLGRGAFGPVLASVPPRDECGPLWDHVTALMALPQFYELTMERRSPPH